MRIIELILKVLRGLLGFLTRNKRPMAKVFGGFAVAGAGVGVAANEQGKRINRKAAMIRDKAMAEYEKSDSETKSVLDRLGKLQLETMESFDTFVEAMGKLQGKPKGLIVKPNDVSLPKYDAKELKMIANNARMALAGAGGAAAGAAAGVAAFGVEAFVLAPAAAGMGVVLCAKGIKLYNKAVNNRREAYSFQREVERIKLYHRQIRESANLLIKSLETVQFHYYTYLHKLKELVLKKTEWKELNKEERLIVKNTIQLVKIMHKMCVVRLIKKAGNDDKLEEVNAKEVKSVVENAEKGLLGMNIAS